MLLTVLMSWRRSAGALLLVVLAVVPACIRAEMPVVNGTLPEDYIPALKPILEAALHQSPQVIRAQLDLAYADARVYERNAPRLPQFGGNANYGTNKTSVSGGGNGSRDTGLFYSLSLSQNLFQWGALKNDTERARVQVLIMEKRITEARRQLASAVRQAYLDLIVKKAALRQLRYSLDLSRQGLVVLRDRLSHGEAAQSEVYDAEMGIEEGTLFLDGQDAEYATSRRIFARMVGLTDFEDAAVPADLPKPNFTPDLVSLVTTEMLRNGGRGAIAAQIAELGVRDSELEYKVNKVRTLPKFRFNAGYSLQNTTNATPNSVSQTGVTNEGANISVDWSIFDGFATRGYMREAQANKRIHEREEQTFADVALDAAQALQRQIGLDVRSVSMTDNRHTLAAGAYKHAQEEFDRGKAPKADIDNALTTVYQKEAESFRARAYYFSHWSDLVALAGADPAFNTLPARYVREKK